MSHFRKQAGFRKWEHTKLVGLRKRGQQKIDGFQMRKKSLKKILRIKKKNGSVLMSQKCSKSAGDHNTFLLSANMFYVQTHVFLFILNCNKEFNSANICPLALFSEYIIFFPQTNQTPLSGSDIELCHQDGFGRPGEAAANTPFP